VVNPVITLIHNNVTLGSAVGRSSQVMHFVPWTDGWGRKHSEVEMARVLMVEYCMQRKTLRTFQSPFLRIQHSSNQHLNMREWNEPEERAHLERQKSLPLPFT
jgi:hypothetical protein